MAWVDYTEDFEQGIGDWYNDSTNEYVWYSSSEREVYEGNKSCVGHNPYTMYLVYDLGGTYEGDLSFYYYMSTFDPTNHYITAEYYYNGSWTTWWSSTDWIFAWTSKTFHFNNASKLRIGMHCDDPSFYSHTNQYYVLDLLRVDCLSYYPYPIAGSEVSVSISAEGSGEVALIKTGSSEASVNINVEAGGVKVEQFSGFSESFVSINTEGSGGNFDIPSSSSETVVEILSTGLGYQYEHPSGGARAWNAISAEGDGYIYNPVPVIDAEQNYNTIKVSWIVGVESS